MVHSYDDREVVTVVVADPGADKKIHLLKAPCNLEILDAWACADTTVNASTADYYSLQLLNYGTAGTATSGTVTAALRGTVGWSANVPYAFTISEGTVSDGEYIVLDYAEAGTVGPGRITVGIEYVRGVGA